MAYGFVSAPGESGIDGCVLRITFESAFSGRPYVVTDGNGDERRGVVPSGLVASVSVKNCNTTYEIISETADGEEYINTVTTGPYFGQYEATLVVFEATIQVTTVPGAKAIANCSGSVYRATAGSNGVASVIVKRPGEYQVYAAISGVSSNTPSVDVAENGGSYSTSVGFRSIVLTSPVGSAISITKGSVTKSGTSTGTDTFYLPSDGTWTVIIGKGTDSATGTVTVMAYKAYPLKLDFVKVYGVEWDGTSTTAWTRTDDAADFTDPVPYVAGATSYGSPFDTLQPWAGMVKSERTGGTMVAIPKFWYTLTQNGAGLKIQIADKAKEGFHVSPAHMDRGDGKGERDVVYVGRYRCNETDLKSMTGRMCKRNIYRSTARSQIHALGTNIWQSDFAMRFTIWLLYLVEFADWNSQAKIGFGGSAGNGSYTIEGQSDSMPYHTGTSASSRNACQTGVQYRNIEGLWDNRFEWCDGCYTDTNGLNIILKPSNFSNNSGGICVGVPSIGFPSSFSVNSEAGFPLFIPSASNGSESTYSCDYWTAITSTTSIYVGGASGSSKQYGLFNVAFIHGEQSSDIVGCRLQELP